MPETLSITEQQLAEALARWEAQSREGTSMLTRKDTDGMTPEEVGKLSAKFLWEDLKVFA